MMLTTKNSTQRENYPAASVSAKNTDGVEPKRGLSTDRSASDSLSYGTGRM